MSIAIPREYTARVVTTTILSPKVVHVCLESAEAVPFQSGQYASWLIETHRRPLSFAWPPEAERLEFVVGTAAGGVASRYVSALRPSDTVHLLAPYGRFTLPERSGERPLLFIAAGTGIAPIRAQLYDELRSQRTQPVTLFFANRDEAHMFFDEEFTQAAEMYSRLTYVPVLAAPTEAWSGKRGLVTTVVPERVPDLERYEAYVCGSPTMVSDTVAMLERFHLDKTHVHTEQYL